MKNVKRINFEKMEIGKNYYTVLLINQLTEKRTKNDDAYVVFGLSDGKISVSAIYFHHSVEDIKSRNIDAGTIVCAEIIVEEYSGEKRYQIGYLEPYEGDDLSLDDFLPRAPIDFEKVFSELKKMLIESHVQRYDGDTGENAISGLAISLITENKELFLKSAAGKLIHHNFIGGLLMHSYNVARLAVAMSDYYPDIDKELLVCGAVLHDIGKVKELVTEKSGNVIYSDEGRLLGHSAIGMRMVDEMSKRNGKSYDRERVLMLEHLILAHHGHYESGSSVMPAILEASVLHSIDSIDGKSNVYKKAYKDVKCGTLTQEICGLGYVSAYKPIPVIKSSTKEIVSMNEMSTTEENNDYLDDCPW